MPPSPPDPADLFFESPLSGMLHDAYTHGVGAARFVGVDVARGKDRTAFASVSLHPRLHVTMLPVREEAITRTRTRRSGRRISRKAWRRQNGLRIREGHALKRAMKALERRIAREVEAAIQRQMLDAIERANR